MQLGLLLLGIALVGVVLWDTFETIVLPRTVSRRYRLTRYYFRGTWVLARTIASLGFGDRRRRAILSAYGPLSLIGLVGVWAALLIFGFALVHFGSGTFLDSHRLESYLYFSGTTFFTLGFGDLTPRDGMGRFLSIFESGVGFGFLAAVIGYLPVLYQSFSHRESWVSLLLARAGSPPNAGNLLERYARHRDLEPLFEALQKMEAWCASLDEGYVSYPVVAFYRSQQDRESWLTALTVILDAGAILQMGLRSDTGWEVPVVDQAELTSAMATRVATNLAKSLGLPEESEVPDRLLVGDLESLRRRLARQGMHLWTDEEALDRLVAARAEYEPVIFALSKHLQLEVPPFQTLGGKDQPDVERADVPAAFLA